MVRSPPGVADVVPDPLDASVSTTPGFVGVDGIAQAGALAGYGVLFLAAMYLWWIRVQALYGDSDDGPERTNCSACGARTPIDDDACTYCGERPSSDDRSSFWDSR